MNKLDDAVEEIKRVLIGNKSKDVNDVYLGNAIRFIEEYQKDAGDRQPKQYDTRTDEALQELITFTLKQNAVPSDIIYDFYRPNNQVISYEEVAESYPPSITERISTLVTYFSIACHRMDFTTEIVNYHNMVKDRFVKEGQPEEQRKAHKVLSTVVASEYFSDFKKELAWALEGIAPENLVDVKYQVCKETSRNEYSAIVIYKK